MAELTITPLTPRIGAEVSGVDLSTPLEPAAVERLKQALADHLVLFFRDQPIDHDSHKRLGRAFGPLQLHSAVQGLDDHPEIVAIHADADSTYVAGEDWHSDLTCDAEPPLGSILYLQTIPASGGDTLFSSMYAAWEALSPRMQALLGGLTAIHDADHVYRPLFPDLDRKYPCSTHPVVRTHPVTGRKALFVNSSYVTRIVELPKAESDAVLAFLYAHVQNPNFQVRFRWTPHAIAFWDNRCTQHLATWDYFPQVRSGYRVTIAGDRPF
ncbi:MAG TPA: TauD/TfdA family dioxygenase [Caulobacteraceae bacterium]|nr:TauD/TfdA family dioxygenase [Caulobacteraceae bacterium]